MSVQMKKTWFVDGEFVEQVIADCKAQPESEIYKREWVGLTDDEVRALSPFYIEPSTYDMIRAAEAKLKEKNYD